MVSVFIDDEAGYRDWMAQNPNGFVLNSSIASPRSSSHVLHAAGCWTIRPTDDRQWTHGYLKACGSAEDVIRFAESVIRYKPFPCGHCGTAEQIGPHQS